MYVFDPCSINSGDVSQLQQTFEDGEQCSICCGAHVSTLKLHRGHMSMSNTIHKPFQGIDGKFIQIIAY